ncbi:hypothetical protein Clacol_008686 [Clathrus columnatus]|uniref:Rieske domain-containing protein n=1 Tax=Clathrus columnatus TaxID=1419009 RepID=A0AAV5AKY9_9AGAM|nr:hypothetical protein Clacol_008686 [Clathrus columnatus]
MESECPHLGADLSHADIEEADAEVVAVCPWHSETGLKACTYNVDVRDDDSVWVETPEDGTGWELVELRPVSEEFADPPLTHIRDTTKIEEEGEATNRTSSTSETIEAVVPQENAPKTLIEWAVLILNTPNPKLKVERTRHAVHLFRTGKLKSIGRSDNAIKPPDVPPRHAELQLVQPGKVGKRGKAGSVKNRIAMLHALANIEQWAIDLAWDIIARFGPSHPDLPHQFFSDFTKVALDESKHFSLLSSRLDNLSSYYGSLPIHAALWESATSTSQSLASRLAIIHLVHEARGLDVNPNTIEKFRTAGDMESVKVLETIHYDEITHVTAGHRWFTWICGREGWDPVKKFRSEVKSRFVGRLKGPFNEEDRRKAGLTRDFYEDLDDDVDENHEERERDRHVDTAAAAAVKLAYET